MSTVTFDSVEVGDEIPAETVHLDREGIAAHARLLDRPYPRFTDEEGARAEGLPGQITPGAMTLALLARALLDWAPSARLRRLGTTFRGLVMAGSTVTVHGMVTEKHEATRSVECDVWMESAEGDRLVIGTASLGLP